MTLRDDVVILDVKVRLIQEADLPALEWGGEYSHFRYFYREIFENSVRKEAVLWVADHKNAGLVGQLFVQLISKRKKLADGSLRAYFFGFRIQSLYRGMGVGTALLNMAEQDLLNRGYRWAILNVNRENHGQSLIPWNFLFSKAGPKRQSTFVSLKNLILR